jgi:hypothetical protein
MDWPPERVFEIFTPAHQAQTNDGDYPKCFILLDGGAEDYLPAERAELEDYLTVIFVLRYDGVPYGEPLPSPDLPASDLVLPVVHEFRQFIRRNFNLGGLVNCIKLNEWTTDSGFTYPESTAVISLTVKYHHEDCCDI